MSTATLVKKRRPRLMRAERIPSVFEEDESSESSFVYAGQELIAEVFELD